MRRPGVITAIVFGGFLFLGISAMLARGLSATGAERSRVFDVLEAQARGDSDAVLAELPSCRRVVACAATVRARAPRLRRDGEVKILQYKPSVQLALKTSIGSGRVAWRAGDSLPVVQCVRVRREGPLEGAGVELVAIGPPVDSQAACR